MERALWLIPLGFLCLQTAHAGAASKTRKVEELLLAMHLDETTNRLEQAEEARMNAMSRQHLAGVTLDADQRKTSTFHNTSGSASSQRRMYRSDAPDLFMPLVASSKSSSPHPGLARILRM